MWKTVIPLAEIASDPKKRQCFIVDLCALIDCEISLLKGVRGIVVKRAYGTIKTVRQGYIEHLIVTMADDFVLTYEALHADYRSSLVLPALELDSFASYLKGRQDEYYEAFLSVSNHYATHHTGAMVSLAYKTLRPHMRQYVIDSIPSVGALIEAYTVQEVEGVIA